MLVSANGNSRDRKVFSGASGFGLLGGGVARFGWEGGGVVAGFGWLVGGRGGGR